MRIFAFTALACLLSSFNMFGQCQNGRLSAEAFNKISNANRTNISFSYGMYSYQNVEENFYYSSGEDTIFYLGYGKGLWAGGIDEEDNLMVSANTYPDLVKHDYIPGPLDRITGQPIDTFCNAYNRVWTVSAFDVFVHRFNFENGTIEAGNIPLDILEWPAKGNPWLEDLAPQFDLAPFVDVAEDGIYDPVSGDYPIPLEESPEFIPHQFSYSVSNDVSIQSNTFGGPLGIEIQLMNYIVSCQSPTESDQTVFTRMKYHYLGNKPLVDFKLSLFEDNDLGCNLNDYVGYDEELNAVYFYNRNGETFIGECDGLAVPNNNGAIRTTVFLDSNVNTFRHWYLLSVGDTLIPGIDPAGDQEFWDYMNMKWRDGEIVSQGGNGYNPGSTEAVTHVFPARPRDSNGWSMQAVNAPIPVDVRGLSNLVSGPIEHGDSGTINFADHVIYDENNRRLDVFDTWPGRISQLKDEYQQILEGNFDCSDPFEICDFNCVWPGDVNNDKAVTNKDFVLAGLMAGADFQEGIPRAQIATNWFGFESEDWAGEFRNVNLKFGDVNGNGEVNDKDLGHIESNFGRTREDFKPFQERLELQADNGLRIKFDEEEIDVEAAQVFQKIFKTEVLIGDTDFNVSTPLHGISFDLRYDTNMVAPFVQLGDNNSQVFQYGFAGLLNSERQADNTLGGDNKISYAYTNYNGANITIGGLLVEQNFFAKDNARTANPDGRDTLVMKFYNVCAVDNMGNTIDIGAAYDTLILTNLEVDPDVLSSLEETEVKATNFNAFPNPASDLLNIEFGVTSSGEFTMYTMDGRQVYKVGLINQTQLNINTANLENGIYLLQFEDSRNLRTSQKVVIHH